MSRLIDADLLLEELNSFSMRITGSANAMAITIMEETKKSIAKMIEEQPIAYDVNKVVERLEILSDRADDNIMEQEGSEQYWDGFGDGIDKAIKILKSGGIE